MKIMLMPRPRTRWVYSSRLKGICLDCGGHELGMCLEYARNIQFAQESLCEKCQKLREEAERCKINTMKK
jgi:hypothetical protein